MQEKWYEVSEEAQYYDAWVKALEKALPIRADWWRAAAFEKFRRREARKP
jgi:hypothetical protein